MNGKAVYLVPGAGRIQSNAGSSSTVLRRTGALTLCSLRTVTMSSWKQCWRTRYASLTAGGEANRLQGGRRIRIQNGGFKSALQLAYPEVSFSKWLPKEAPAVAR